MPVVRVGDNIRKPKRNLLQMRTRLLKTWIFKKELMLLPLAMSGFL